MTSLPPVLTDRIALSDGREVERISSGDHEDAQPFSPGDTGVPPAPTFLDLVHEHFSWRSKILFFEEYQDLLDHTSANPENGLFQIPTASSEVHFRPDFQIRLPRLEASLKPRGVASRRSWRQGALRGHVETHAQGFINEWKAQLQIDPSLFVAYGKENLQWGPSFVASPSNPFFMENGKLDPFREIEGQDLVRLIYFPSERMTLSWIRQTEHSMEDLRGKDLPTLDAIKIDASFETSSGALIVSDGQEDRFRTGGYWQWTASDAVLLYAEFGVSRGTDMPSPKQNSAVPLGVEWVPRDEDSGWFPTVLTGGSYTFLMGPTLTLEFIFNRPGLNGEEARQFFALRQNAADALMDPMWEPLARAALAQTVWPDRFLRRYYLMTQFLRTEIKDRLDVNLSYIHNIDDRSGSVFSFIEWDINDAVQLFNVTTVNRGATKSEFGSVMRWRTMVGVEISF